MPIRDYEGKSAKELIAEGAAALGVSEALFAHGPDILRTHPYWVGNYVMHYYPALSPRQRQTLIQAIRNSIAAANRQANLSPTDALPLSAIPVVPGRTGAVMYSEARFIYRVVVLINVTGGGSRYVTVYVESDGPLNLVEIEREVNRIVKKEMKPDAFTESWRGKRAPGPLTYEVVSVTRNR